MNYYFFRKILPLVFGISFSLTIENSFSQQAGPEDDFSMIYICRPRSVGSASTQYRVYFKDRLVHVFQSGSRIAYKMYSEGELKIITESVFMGNTLPGKNNYIINIENGKNYYFKLTSSNVSFVQESEGKVNFENISQYKNELIQKEEDKIIPILTMPEAGKNKQKSPEQFTDYRGGGDPLKGLNVAKAKDLVIGNYYALIIGIDKYSGTWSPLRNAVSDAKAVESLLKEKYKIDHFKTLYNEEATRKNIIVAMEWLNKNVKEKDNLLIYYSGHGEYKQDLNKGYWVPIDAQTSSTSDYISNNDIQTFLGGIKSKHTLLIADACFSGDILRGNTIAVPFEESERYYKEVNNLTSRQALTSGGIEPVMDGGKDGHSVFAYYLMKSLLNNQSKYFDVSQLYSNIKIPITNNSDQSPQFQSIKNTGDEGGQFIFIKK